MFFIFLYDGLKCFYTNNYASFLEAKEVCLNSEQKGFSAKMYWNDGDGVREVNYKEDYVC